MKGRWWKRLWGNRQAGLHVAARARATRRFSYQPLLEGLEDRPLPPAAYYVALSGSDVAAGTAAAPWRTLQHAADSVHAGDTVLVQPGNYAGFSLSTSGTAAAPITFLAQGAVTITSPVAATGDGIDLVGASYVTIQEFSVNAMLRAGIAISNA